MKKFLKYGIAALTCIMVLACQKNVPADGGSEAASLTIRLALPSVSLDTKAKEVYPGLSDKGVVDDPFASDISGWTDYEKLIDARVIYRLTMFLVDRVAGILVGYRDFYYKGIAEGVTSDSEDICGAESVYGRNGLSNDGTVAEVTFDYDHPLHNLSDGSLEKLERGEYRMIVVANWSPVTITSTAADGNEYTRTYKGLKDGKGNFFGTYVNSILEQYKNQTVAKPLRFSRKADSAESEYADYHNLMDFTLYSCDKHFLCALNPQPLVLVQDFELQPGVNRISGQLRRTWARLRIAVENLSDEVLTVRGLEFGKNTTRNESFLFYAPGNEDFTLRDPDWYKTSGADKTTKYGAPAISDSDEIDTDHPDTYNAWVAFHPGTNVSPVGSSVNRNRTVLFDGYILDCDGNGNPFTYKLDLLYDDALTSDKKWTRKFDLDGNPEVLTSEYDEIKEGVPYLLWSQGTAKRMLYAGDDRLQTEDQSNLNKDSYDAREVFMFVPVRDSEGNIRTERITRHYKYGTHYDAGMAADFPYYRIMTYDGRYVGRPNRKDAGNIKLDKTPETAFVLRDDATKIEHPDRKYLSFWAVEKNNVESRDYINIDGGNSDIVAGWNDNDSGSAFWLYPLEEVLSGPAFNDVVRLSTVDPETAAVSPVEAIHRNDFINILISVSYNKHSGEIDFKVKDWNDVSGDIEFN